MNVPCPYCGGISDLVSGDAVYPHRQDLHAKKFYRCAPCDAYVGCHPGTQKPLGRLANAELRAAKIAAHAAFDPLWTSKQMSRSEAYTWLAKELGIRKQDCHIGMFGVATCQQVVRAAAALAG